MHHPGGLPCHGRTKPVGFHKTSDLGNHADSQQECFQRLDACMYVNILMRMYIYRCIIYRFVCNLYISVRARLQEVKPSRLDLQTKINGVSRSINHIVQHMTNKHDFESLPGLRKNNKI